MDDEGINALGKFPQELHEWIDSNPLSFGIEPGAILSGCVVITVWRQSGGQHRICLFPDGDFMDRDYFIEHMSYMIEIAELGLDPE